MNEEIRIIYGEYRVIKERGFFKRCIRQEHQWFATHRNLEKCLKTGIQTPDKLLGHTWQMGWAYIKENCHVSYELASNRMGNTIDQGPLY